MWYQPKQASQSEDPTHAGYTISIVLVGHKEKDKPHYNQHSIYVIPSLGKEVFWTYSHDSYQKL